MSTNQSLLDDLPVQSREKASASPGRMLVILAVLIFSAEVIAMIVLYFLPLPNYFLATLLDGSIMLVLILPGLYYLQLKPLIRQMEERDQVERALRTNEELFRKVLELLPVGVLVVDRDGKIVHNNPRSEQIWGSYSSMGISRYAEFKGWWASTGEPVDPDDWAAARAIRQGKTFLNEEIEIETFEADHKIILNSAVPILDERKSIRGAVVVNQDITRRRLSEKTLARQNEELQTLFRSESTARQFAETLSAASQALAETLDLDTVLSTLLEHLTKILPSEIAFATLLESDAHPAVRATRSSMGQFQMNDLPSQFKLGHTTDALLQRMKLNLKSLTIPHIEARTAVERPEDGSENGPEGGTEAFEQIHIWLIVPIIAGQKIIGLIELGRRSEEEFSLQEANRAEAITALASVAIQNARLYDQTRAGRERLQSLANRLVEIQENERAAVARELHDEAGQVLSSLKLSLGRLEQSPDCPVAIKERLHELKVMADGVLEELHGLAMDLRPVVLDRLGLVAALQQYTRQLDGDGLKVQFKAVGYEKVRLPREVETSIYRIVQEAITNVIRHAEASQVGVLLERGRSVRVTIEDDGRGFKPEQVDFTSHLGLTGIRERVEMLGGNLTVESTPGLGTSIIVEVPYGDSNLDR